MANKTPRITLYSTAGCAHCRQLKAWLKRHHLAFREFDIQRNARAFREFQRLGGRGVPLLLVGEQRIQGFDAKKLPARLRKAGVSL
ncbi:glutaredoxin family protein [Thiolapillus sp.]